MSANIAQKIEAVVLKYPELAGNYATKSCWCTKTLHELFIGNVDVLAGKRVVLNVDALVADKTEKPDLYVPEDYTEREEKREQYCLGVVLKDDHSGQGNIVLYQRYGNVAVQDDIHIVEKQNILVVVDCEKSDDGRVPYRLRGAK